MWQYELYSKLCHLSSWPKTLSQSLVAFFVAGLADVWGPTLPQAWFKDPFELYLIFNLIEAINQLEIVII